MADWLLYLFSLYVQLLPASQLAPSWLPTLTLSLAARNGPPSLVRSASDDMDSLILPS